MWRFSPNRDSSTYIGSSYEIRETREHRKTKRYVSQVRAITFIKDDSWNIADLEDLD